jgi:hypothetical protein
MGCLAVASVLLFVAVYGPALASFPPGSRVKPGMNLPMMLTLPFGYAWWSECFAAGIRQLFARPRYYGLITIGIGVLQFSTFRIVLWLLMGSRGIEWGTA